MAVQTHDPTLEDGYHKRFIVDNRMCFVDLFDTYQGQDEYVAVREHWIREGQGFILVYSIASRSTFNRLEAFHQSMQRLKQGDPIFILLLRMRDWSISTGNKSDNAFEREVSKDEGAALARRFGCKFIETSTKTAQNVERVFTNLVRALRHATDPEPQIPLRKKKCLIL
ncbi:ras protein [Mycena olivaceomarginata]|nr:ras protein [Mycena olivaceomarginata]